MKKQKENNTMNTPVKFELAKLLKDNGFDKILKYHYPNLSIEKQEICLPTNWNNFTDMSGNANYYSAPTITEVVMWLYEKHGIWIGIDKMFSKEFFYNITTDNEHNSKESIEFFNSPTEAYEAAIEHVLKNII